MADFWAGEAARQVEVSWGTANLNKILDGSAWKIQDRIMAAIRHHEHKTLERRDIVPYIRENLDEQLADQGHWLIQQGNRRLCMSCGQSWGSGTRRNMLRLGLCPGPLQWGHWPRMPSVPWAVPRGSELVHCGQVIHYTHVLKWHRGILWCCTCGAYSHRRVVFLPRPCRMKAVNS